jgi:hypothetical protein
MGKLGEGVHDIYKERAAAGGDVLWYVTIKGQSELAPGIPLHMSLKVFLDKKDMDLKEIKAKVKKFDIQTPDPKKLKYNTTIFTSKRDGNKYYMLKLEGTDKSYEDFYNSMKHVGTVYEKFMPHITIDKGLYDKINEEGIKPEEVTFDHLSIEAGSGNTVHTFEKSELLTPTIVRETIMLDLSLMTGHKKAAFLPDEFLENYLKDNPGLKEKVIEKHDQRLSHHFGGDLELITFAWEHGLDKAYAHKHRK